MITSITKENHETEIERSDKPVVLDVFATWCGPCIQMMPIMEELAQEYGDKYKFVKLNVDEARDLAIKYGVTSVPTFVFIINNEVKGKEIGYIAKDQFVEKMTEYLG